jgi:sodium/potassium-transporting ATPase subunit alpha
MVKTIALSTTSFFQYTPDTDELRARVAKVSNYKVDSDALKELEPGSEVERIFNEQKELMIEEEGKMNYIKRAVKGDASETGLVKFSQPVLMKEYEGDYVDGLNDIRKAFPLVKTGLGDDIKDGEIPFSSDIKFNLLIRDNNQEVRSPSSAEENITVYIKGAPEKILNRCSHILENGNERLFDEVQRANVDFANDTFGSTGERVLAFAKLELDPERYGKGAEVGTPGYQFDVSTWKAWNDVKEFSDSVEGWFPMWDFRLCGLASLNDPPRPKVDVSVQKCKNAGIKVIMVTGDQPPTAAAIAFKVNIITQPHLEYDKMVDAWKKANPVEEFADQRAYEEAFAIAEEDCMKNSKAIVIHGDKLAKVMAKDDAMEDDEIEKGRTVMDWIRKPEVVFARTTPSQKLIIVDACQRLGHVVAVTGDGVNDSPAIKKADIGIAMGSGSEVAQNAADMLLLDDNFSSIVNGVEEGRLIFDNLKKSIAYTLSSNIPEISPFIIYMAA